MCRGDGESRFFDGMFFFDRVGFLSWDESELDEELDPELSELELGLLFLAIALNRVWVSR